MAMGDDTSSELADSFFQKAFEADDGHFKALAEALATIAPLA